MRHTSEIRRTGAQFHLAGFTAMAFGLLFLLFLGLPSAHAQSPIGTAESCFEAGPDHVPAFTATPVPPVRQGHPAQGHSQAPAASDPAVASLTAARLLPADLIPDADSATGAKLMPAGFTPLQAQPVHMLNTGYKDQWIPTLRKTPELLAENR